MKTSLVLISLFSVFGIGCQSIGDCINGSGPVVTSTLDLSPFHSLNFSGSDIVYLSQGEEQEVIVEGQQNVIDLLNRSVQNGVWDVRIMECVRRHEPLVYYITMSDIQGLSMTGSGKIIGENRLNATELDIRLTGSGSIDAEINASVDCEITGSGEVILNGDSESADISVTGSGVYEGYDLKTAQADVNIQGSGDVYLTCTDILDVLITGSGTVYYKGNPSINSSITGSGKLVSRN